MVKKERDVFVRVRVLANSQSQATAIVEEELGFLQHDRICRSDVVTIEGVKPGA